MSRRGKGRLQLGGLDDPLSALFTIISILSLPSLFGYISAGAEGVIRTGIAYSEVRLVALVIIVWTASQRAFFDGLGKTWIFMVIALV